MHFMYKAYMFFFLQTHLLHTTYLYRKKPQSQAVLYIHDMVSMVVVCDWIKNRIMYDAIGNIELWIRKRKRNVHFTLLSVLCCMHNYCRSIPWICFLKTKYVMAMLLITTIPQSFQVLMDFAWPLMTFLLILTLLS